MHIPLSSWYDDILELDPEHLAGSDSWAGHIPFAFYLIAALAPKTLVELGVFAGNSLFAFAQAASRQQIASRIIGIDTWESDPHSGGYDGDSIHRLVCEQQARYPDKVELKRATFDAIRPDIPDNTIDLLHIDGYHHYDAVSHDFHSWRSALKPEGVILFHDIAVRRDDFGVWRFWDEIKASHGVDRVIEFSHSNGLGVLFLGPDDAYPEKMQALRRAYAGDPQAVQTCFRLAGARIAEHFAHRQTRRLADEEKERHAQELHREQTAHTAQQNELARQLNILQTQHRQVIESSSWRLTAPLRALWRKTGL